MVNNLLANVKKFGEVSVVPWRHVQEWVPGTIHFVAILEPALPNVSADQVITDCVAELEGRILGYLLPVQQADAVVLPVSLWETPIISCYRHLLAILQQGSHKVRNSWRLIPLQGQVCAEVESFVRLYRHFGVAVRPDDREGILIGVEIVLDDCFAVQFV